MKRLTALLASLTLALLTFGCGGETTTNSTTNSNTAVVVNNNATRTTTTTTNTTTTSNRGGYNANITQEEYEKDKDAFGQKAKDLGDKVGSSLTDGWIWTKTRGALMAADDLEETNINVDVNNGVITLRGTVPNADQVKKADTVAKGVSGNKGVQNQLKAGAGGGANANAAKK